VKAFLVDLSYCNGCYNCQIACKDEHVANDWTPYAKPQPDYGQFWLRMQETVRGTVPKVKVSYIPIPCLHCDNAKCMTVCKANAIYRREDGMIVIDPVKCTGCKLCPDSCPNGSIFFNEGLNIAQKCTGCAHLLDDGWDVPRCVDACPTEAIRFGEESEFKDQIAKAEVLNQGCGAGRVYYLNLPKKFVAGTVYDPVEKEVVIGATCTLKDKDKDGRTHTAVTDNFGDFWFNDLPDGHGYSLEIRKGANVKNLESISTAKDVNLGDIPLRLL
jgi:Fe-S-cluster-containing dehydrogenase component